MFALVSASARIWCYLCETVERVAECDMVEIANIHAGFLDVAENVVRCRKRLGEYLIL
jgi:hypothetical protein